MMRTVHCSGRRREAGGCLPQCMLGYVCLGESAPVHAGICLPTGVSAPVHAGICLPTGVSAPVHAGICLPMGSAPVHAGIHPPVN